MKQFTKKNLITYLKINPDRKFNFGDVDNCVIASFLKEFCGCSFARVGNDNYDYEFKGVSIKYFYFNKWQNKLDRDMIVLSDNGANAITARQVLSLLK